MLCFSPLLGTNLPLLGTGRSPLATSSKFQSIGVSRFPLVPLIQAKALTLHSPLIRTSKLLATNTDRSEIGWDNWNPLDSSLDLDSFDLSVEKDAGAVKGSDDRSERLDSSDDPNLDFFTTILAPTAVIDRPLERRLDRERDDRLSTNPDDVIIKSSPKKERSKSTKKSKSKLATQIDSVKIARHKSEQITPRTDILTNIETSQPPSPKVDESKSIAANVSELVSEKLPELDSSIVSLSLQIETALTSSNLLEINTGSSKLDSDNLQLDPPTFASAPLQSKQLETTPVTPLLENTESVIELSSDRSSIDSRSIQPNIDRSILLRSLQPEATFISSDEIGVDAELREVNLGNFGIDPLSISSNIEPQVLAVTALTNIQPQEISIPSQRLETDPALESEVNSSNLHLAPVSIPTNINSPPPLPISPPFSQLEPPLIDRLEVNTEFTSDVTSDRVQSDRVSIPTEINPPLLTSNSSLSPQLDPRSTQSNQPEVITDSIEVSSKNLPLDRLSISTNIHPSVPVNLTPFPPLEEKIIALPQLEIDPESASKVNLDSLPIDPLSISTEISPGISQSNLFLSLQLEERSTPNRQTEIDSRSETEANSDNLPIDPLSISADINSAITPANLSPSSQLDVIPTRSSQLGVSNKDSDPSLSNLQPDSQPNPPTITLILPLSSQQDETSTPTQERGVEIESTSEPSLDNLPLQISATKIINENSPIDSAADPSLNVKNTSLAITNDFDSQSDIKNETNSNLQVTDDTFTRSEELLSSPVNSEENLKPSIPVRGYATGGYVKESDRVEPESIAASDTVAAMLTPGEFVINAKDAQKNLNLLTHINSGGEPDTSIESQTRSISTYNPLTSIQAKIQNSTIDNSLQRQVDLHQILFLNPSPLNNSAHSPAANNQSVTNYSSPDLIFRKLQSDRRTEDNTIFRTPDEWGNIEELMNGGSYNSDSFNFNNVSRDSPPPDLTTRSIASSSPALASKMSPARGADGENATPPDISREIEPIVQTIAASTSTNEQQSNDAAELEILAREIYHRLRQRLEIERERHGSYSGNLSW